MSTPAALALGAGRTAHPPTSTGPAVVGVDAHHGFLRQRG